MLQDGAQKRFMDRRVNLPTAKGHADIVRDIPARIRARSFFSARVAEPEILEKLREISDGYSRGATGLGEARNKIKEFLAARGYDPHAGGLKNLASTARINLILRQNEAMARAVGEYDRTHTPEAMKLFPYFRYVARTDGRTRSAHSDLNGRIFRKDDPFLKTHTPPWEFNCRCRLEQISEREAGKTPNLIQPPTPPENVRVESASGFSFDPAEGFEAPADLTGLRPVSRAAILEQAGDAVKAGKLGNVGMIVAPPETGLPSAPLSGEDAVKQGFEAMKEAAREEIRSAGLNPDNLPDYEVVNRTFENSGKNAKNIPAAVLNLFPDGPTPVGQLNERAAEAAGLPPMPVMLERGNSYRGIAHLWRNHKELFADPDAAIRLLNETIGNPNCRVVVSLKRAMSKIPIKGGSQKTPICLKRIVLHNPETRTCCVMIHDGRELKLVSWNNAGDDYGKDEWTLE